MFFDDMWRTQLNEKVGANTHNERIINWAYDQIRDEELEYSTDGKQF